MRPPAVVLVNLRLLGNIDGLQAGHAMQAIYNVRDICIMGESQCS
jgi:hypothetical protein